MDPVDEFNSPYLYSKNCPTRFVDPNGTKVSVDRALIGSKEFVAWAEKSDAAKMLVSLFGKGGPLEKFDVSFEYREFREGKGGETVIKLNGIALDAGKEFQKSGELKWSVMPSEDYSFDVLLDPGNKGGWNNKVPFGGGTTGDNEIAHVFYSILNILKANAGEDAKMYLGTDQHRDVRHMNPRDAMQFFGKILDELKEQGVDVSKINPSEVTKENIESLIEIKGTNED